MTEPVRACDTTCVIGAHPSYLLSICTKKRTLLSVSSLPDIDRLRLQKGDPLTSRGKRRSAPRPQLGEPFLRGPISWPWLTVAALLPGKALQVALVVWFLAGLKRSDEVPLQTSRLAALGVSRHAAYRAVAALERARLISVSRRIGRQSLIRLLVYKSANTGENRPDAGQ